MGLRDSREPNLFWHYIPCRVALYLHILYNRYNHMDGHINGLLLPVAVCHKPLPHRDGYSNSHIQLDRDR